MTDVYNIAVKIGMQNGVSSVLRVIQGDLFGLNQTVDLTSGKFKLLAVVAGGAMAAIAGTAALRGMGKIIEAGDKIIQQQQKLRMLGFGNADVNSLTSQAISVATSTPGYSAAQVLGIQNDLVRSLGSAADANSVLKSTTQDAFVIQRLTGDTSDKGILAAIKAVDVQGGATKNGKIDPQTFAANLHAMTAAIAVSNGLLSPEQILQITRMAGPTAQGADFSSWIFSNLSAFMNMGRIAGRGINMAGRDLLAGYSTKVSAAEGLKLGLYGSDAITKDFDRYYIDPSKVVGGDVLTDPKQGIPAWVQQVLVPKLMAAGFVTPQQIAQEVDRLIPNITAQRYISQEAIAAAQQNRDLALAIGSNGQNLFADAQGSLNAQMQDFTASWNSLIQALGLPMVKTAIGVMQNITATINEFSNWAFTHQNTVKIIDVMLASLAGALTVLGAAAMIGGLVMLVGATGTGGLVFGLAAGIAALVASFAALSVAFPELFNGPNKALQYKKTGNLWLDDPTTAIENAFGRYFGGNGGTWAPGPWGSTTWVPPSSNASSSTPQSVVVVNHNAIARAMHQGLAGAANTSSAYPNGSTGTNSRITFPGTPALASP
ncbi:MAG: hypothetical protein P4L10_10920 [Acidobacteriaceae bacterium]|nr:hypothetical protein [Acidobacteriaceae bacterium]